MMRFYLGSCDFKWTHREEKMAHIWVRRELGEELYKQCNQPGYDLHLEYSDSMIVPDKYCRCDIYVDVHDSPSATWFALKYTRAQSR
jgi:hypothetical protein